jgi:hypothetical protein
MSGRYDHTNVRKQVENNNVRKGAKRKRVNITESGNGGARKLRAFLLRQGGGNGIRTSYPDEWLAHERSCLSKNSLHIVKKKKRVMTREWDEVR